MTATACAICQDWITTKKPLKEGEKIACTRLRCEMKLREQKKVKK